MQLLDEHLWKLYDEGKIGLEEMMDKARQPGALYDKAKAKITAMKGGKAKLATVKTAAEKELDDLGPILRT